MSKHANHRGSPLGMAASRRILLSHAHWDTMRAHVESCLPMEGCGLLVGIGETVLEVLPITNQENSPYRFRMDAREQLRAFRLMEDRQMELLGIFHSHTADARGAALPAIDPSPTDIQEAAYPVVNVIWYRQDRRWQARGFWIEGSKVSGVQLCIEAGPQRPQALHDARG